MCHNHEKAYIQSCTDCQWNKSSTTKPPGPLHPLPVPDECGQLVAMDFIGPLKDDMGFNCILSIADCLGAKLWLSPPKLTSPPIHWQFCFFDHWYCQNGLPLNIISDHDKLFMLRFWKALTTLCGVKLKMLTAYHPDTDGSSEQTNKTINQCLCFHVSHQPKGWVHMLHRIHFAIMSMVNALTGFSNFQLHLGHTLCVISPIIPLNLPPVCYERTFSFF